MPRKPDDSHAAGSVDTVTAQRAARLFKLLRLLGEGPQTRSGLLRRLRLDIRGFYRDLEVLRRVGLRVVLEGRRYHLEGDLEAALDRLPLPDPHLTVGEARLLARGRTRAHQKLKDHLDALLP